MPLEITETGIKLALNNGSALSEPTDKNDATEVQIEEQPLKAEIDASVKLDIERLDNSSEHR